MSKKSVTVCPSCKVECVKVIGGIPRPDDFSVCSRCGAICQFNEDFSLRLCDYDNDVDLFCNTSLEVFNYVTDARNYIQLRKELGM